ncbi:hypothetical protein GGH92_002475 [Coemansia sp. RSA 2673]|nr:hypothetical protein GGH92_002475 [Coemansia sp. RSA 2673]
MLAPGLVALTRRHRALAKLQPPLLNLYLCERRQVSALHSLSVPQPAINNQARLLRELRTSITNQDSGAAVRIYGELRGAWLTDTANDSRHTELRMGDLRAFHILLRRSAARLESSLSEERRHALFVVVVQAIDDMQRLGLRVGATEVAAALYAHNQLGHYSETIDRWRAAVSQLHVDAGSMPTDLDLSVRHLFPQTHIYALTAAVSLKSLRSVRDIYRDAVRLMSEPPMTGPPAAFFWALFPTQAGLRASSGSDRAWDASRLGSEFLELALSDAAKWVAGDTQLLSRIVQALVRALLTEGHIHKATGLYERVLAEPRKTAPMTSWILCEMVAGLCRHSLLDDAYITLTSAAQAHCTAHAWNAYLDGVANSMRRAQYTATGRRQLRDEARAPLAVLRRMETCIGWMEKSNGAKPDLATRSIWLRACFRAAEWKRAYAYFRKHYEVMKNDIVCWDIAIRGLFESGDIDAQKEGWRLVGCLVRQADEGGPSVDARVVETILLYLFPRYRPSYQPPPARTLDQQTLADVLAWMETRMPQRRKITYAIVIGSLLATNQIARALEVYRAMVSRKLWPSKSINCMLAKSLATGEQGVVAAARFVDDNFPPHHYAAAFAAIIKPLLLRQQYDDVWFVMDRHYPEVIAPATDRAPALSYPFPTHDMYNMALQAAAANGDCEQHRLFRDRIRAHLDLVSNKYPLPAQRIAHVYAFHHNKA